MDKRSLSERDICTKFITLVIVKAEGDIKTQIRKEIYFTNARIFVKGRKTIRGKATRANYIPCYKPNNKIPTLSKLRLPLPPIAEQQRIVSKLDQLMQFCAQLEQNINIIVGLRPKLSK